MKRLCSAEIRFIAIIVLLLTTLLCSCRTTAGSDHDQIVKSAIDLADSYMRLSRYEDALATYDRALEQTDDYRLYYNKAVALSCLGMDKTAADLCAESFERYPHIISFKVAQAKYLRRAGEKTLSRIAYAKVLELNPYDRETRECLIADLIEDGETKDAYDQALILWEQGYRDARSIEILYDLQPDEWENVYSLIKAKEQ